MKIFIPSTGSGPESKIDANFGRCVFFLLYETDSKTISIYENPHRNEQESVGIAVANEAIRLGADTVITVNLGPNAYFAFAEKNITVYRATENMSIRKAVDAMLAGKLDTIKYSADMRKNRYQLSLN